jgi:hypothetical protein
MLARVVHQIVHYDHQINWCKGRALAEAVGLKYDRTGTVASDADLINIFI